MAVSVEDLGRTLQDIAEHANATDDSLAKLQAGLVAVKALLAMQMNPSHPKQALVQIDKLEQKLSALDAKAGERKKIAEAIEILKLVEKHGTKEA